MSVSQFLVEMIKIILRKKYKDKSIEEISMHELKKIIAQHDVFNETDIDEIM